MFIQLVSFISRMVPKSIILSSRDLGLITKFSGFKSLWTKLFECRNSKP